MAKKEEQTVYDQIVEGLQGSVDFSRGRLSLQTTQLPEPPPEPKPERIVALRRKHNMSQSVFAATLNVSVKTVQAWEQGVRSPSHASARLLQIIAETPAVVEQLAETRRTAPSRQQQ